MPVVDWRKVKSSNGRSERRFIRTVVPYWASMLGKWTFVRRDLMSFRMLLGRQALRKRAVVDVSSRACCLAEPLL